MSLRGVCMKLRGGIQQKLPNVFENKMLGCQSQTQWISLASVPSHHNICQRIHTRVDETRIKSLEGRSRVLRCHEGLGRIKEMTRNFGSVHELSPDEKAAKFNRPKAQTTIDEEEVSKFSDLSALWWDEGGEFEALHSLNDLRIPLIRDALVAQKRLENYSRSKPLEGFWILDVGSGGGILSEPLARLGASVIGVDASEENIKIAQAHLIHDPGIRDKIKYIQATVEDIAETQAGKFDAVVASEVLEHVADANTFVSSSCKLVRPGGSIFFTTLNKTTLSYALGVVVAERVLKLVSPGTHDWQKFIPPMDLEYMLERNNFSTRLVHGMWYSPLTKRWSWTKDTSINYAVHAVRSSSSTEGEQENPWTEPQGSKAEQDKEER